MNFLKNFRKEKGLTSKQMANTLNISISLYEKVESGSRSPSQNFLRRFKHTFPTVDMNIFFASNNHNKCI